MKYKSHLKANRSLFVVLIGICVLCSSFSISASSSNLDELFQEYLREVNEVKSGSMDDAQRIAEFQSLNEAWRKRFQNIIAKNPQSTSGWTQIASELLALNQAVGKIDDALRLNEMLIQSAHSESEKLSLLLNRAEVMFLWNSSGATKGSFDKELPSTFSKAYEQINIAYNPLSKLSFITRYANYFNEQKLFIESANVFLKGAEIAAIAQIDSKYAPLLKDNPAFTQEWFTDSAVRALVHGGKLSEANAAFEQLLLIDELQKPKSYYLERFAQYQDPKQGLIYQEILKKWLDQTPADSHTPYLIFELAQTYYRDGNFAHAAKLYNQLLETELSKPTHDDLDRQAGGYAAEIIYNLARCLEKLGDKKQADALFHSFKQIFTNDPRSGFLKSRLPE